MKTSTIFVLLFLISCSHAAPVKSTYRTRLVDALNIFRREFSIGLNIGNMQEVSFNEDLEKKGKTFGNCNDVKHGANYRILLVPELDSLAKAEPPNGTFIKGMDREEVVDEQFEKYFSELLHPQNSKVACVELKSSCPFPDGHRSGPKTVNDVAKAVCLFGMENSNPMEQWKNGEPGSQCPNGEAESGLCKAVA